MTFFGFYGLSDLFVFFTSLMVGISMIMGVNAVNSAPSFMLNYFQYIARDANAVAKHPKFWLNVLTYYTVVTQVTQTLLEPVNLTTFLQRFSAVFRIEMATLLMLAELLVVMITPHTTHSETGGMAAIIMAAFIGGFGRAFFENSLWVLFSLFPHKYLSGVMIGIPISASLVSILQIILLGAMENTYDSILTQSIIYFAISLGLIFLAGLCVVLLLCNKYARHNVAELRSTRRGWARIYHNANAQSENYDAAQGEGASGSNEPVMGEMQVQPKGEVKQLEGRSPTEEAQEEEVQAVDAAVVPPSGALQKEKLWPIIKKIYPMMIACCLTFTVSCLMVPGVLIYVNIDDNWFTTLIIATFNFGDLIGRSLSVFERLWLSSNVVLIASIARILFIPLLVLCAKHVIPSEAAAYVFTAVAAVTNGFIGTLSMVYGPKDPKLTTDAERCCAGQLTDVSLLVGCSVGSLLQLAIVLAF